MCHFKGFGLYPVDTVKAERYDQIYGYNNQSDSRGGRGEEHCLHAASCLGDGGLLAEAVGLHGEGQVLGPEQVDHTWLQSVCEE